MSAYLAEIEFTADAKGPVAVKFTASDGRFRRFGPPSKGLNLTHKLKWTFTPEVPLVGFTWKIANDRVTTLTPFVYDKSCPEETTEQSGISTTKE